MDRPWPRAAAKRALTCSSAPFATGGSAHAHPATIHASDTRSIARPDPCTRSDSDSDTDSNSNSNSTTAAGCPIA